MGQSEIMQMVLMFIGGLALFLYGMNEMGNGLEKASGGKLEMILEKLTSSTWKGVLLGAAVTGIIQSSSATTVMVVGFVNAGIMPLSRAIGIIMGANIGTTVTAWILSMSDIQGDNIVLQFLKPDNFSPILALIGIILVMFINNEKKKNIGIILLGFAVLMTGMSSMSSAVEPLKEVEGFRNHMVRFSDVPILGMIAGLGLTAIIQSSSASVGILQAFCKTGVLSYGAAIPIIMGQNIGTCVTALLSSIGTKKNAKRAAVVHLMFNVIGTLIFMTVFYTINWIHPLEIMGGVASSNGIAKIHTIFNVSVTLILVWFTKQLEQLACIIIKDKANDEEDMLDMELQKLDERFLNNAALAMEHARESTIKMAYLAKDILRESIELTAEFTKERYESVVKKENAIDLYEDKIGTYLLKLSGKDLSEHDSGELTLLLHLIGDFERIGDHSLNIAQAAKEMNKKELEFSKKAEIEVSTFGELVTEIIDTAVKSFETDDANLATFVEPMEEVADKLNKEIKKRHIKRLRKGKCTPELGFILADITTSFERIADHCSNVAVGIIQTKDEGYESHNYLESLDKGENTVFRGKYLACKEKYLLP